ncbi:MAG: NADAR family protein [Lysobacterales bacterium]
MQAAHSLDELKRQIHAGVRFPHLHFWSHEGPPDREVGKSCLSQWYPARFRVDSVAYASAEHYMMAEKARFFGDSARRQQILAAATPAAAKALGREVANFDGERWSKVRIEIVIAGNLAKFAQNPALGAFLIGTGDQILVEASPVDLIWGIGLAENDPAATDPWAWRGENLLGFALMAVRGKLIAGQAHDHGHGWRLEE